LPEFATDRFRKLLQRQLAPQSRTVDAKSNKATALATTAPDRGTVRIIDACDCAQKYGIKPGLPLADARALLPGLVVADADPVGNASVLKQLAQWCVRYTPWVTPEIADRDEISYTMTGAGIWLDITGCAHLIGGEDALAHDLISHLRGAGYRVHAAVADTPGAAWAASHFNLKTESAFSIVPPGDTMAVLGPLRSAGLRLPDALLADLHRLGLRTIDQVSAIPRESLAPRFGDGLLRRMDQFIGRVGEPISPLTPVPLLRSRLAFAEPIGTRDDIDAALERMLNDLCARLSETQEGIRRMDLVFYRSDGTFQQLCIGTSRPMRDPVHCVRLFREKLNNVDPGFGIDLMILNAHDVTSLYGVQADMQASESMAPDSAPLIDSLANRLGAENVTRLEPRASHIPELAQSERALLELQKRTKGDPLKLPGALSYHHSPTTPRPVHLLPQPEPIDVMAPVPDHPPVLFRWRRERHKVRRADGPERIGPEWWREATRHHDRDRQLRDYYCLEDETGGRYWVFREGLYRPDRLPKWYLHGVFG